MHGEGTCDEALRERLERPSVVMCRQRRDIVCISKYTRGMKSLWHTEGEVRNALLKRSGRIQVPRRCQLTPPVKKWSRTTTRTKVKR